MSRTKIVSIFAVGALALGALFGALSYRSASAATPTTGTATTAAPADLGGPHGRDPGGVSDSDLAASLGITTDQLSAAYKTATADALKAGVDKGLITQAQADQITSGGSAFPLGDRWGAWLSSNGIDYDALLAKALNITVDKLTAARQTAFNTRIDAAVTAGTLTQAQADLEKGEYALRNNAEFKSALQTAYQDAVKAAVAKGVITQAQADAILAQNNGMGGFGFDGFGGHGGPGGRGGHGGRGFQPGNTTNAFPPTTIP